MLVGGVDIAGSAMAEDKVTEKTPSRNAGEAIPLNGYALGEISVNARCVERLRSFDAHSCKPIVRG